MTMIKDNNNTAFHHLFDKKSPLSVLRTSFTRRGQEKTSTTLTEAVFRGFPPVGGKHKGGRLTGIHTGTFIMI